VQSARFNPFVGQYVVTNCRDARTSGRLASQVSKCETDSGISVPPVLLCNSGCEPDQTLGIGGCDQKYPARLVIAN